MLHLLYEALAQKIGIVVRTNSVDRLRQALYQERKKSSDESLKDVVVAVSRDDPAHELWLFNNSKPKQEEPSSAPQE